MAPKKSFVWEYFEIMSDNKTKCNLCGIKLAYSGGTSTMQNHLKYKHASVSTSGSPSKSPENRTLAQGTISGAFGKMKPVSRQRYEKLTRKLALVCVKDLRPIAMVNGSGFKDFCKEMEPGYVVPSHTTIHNYIMYLYKENKDSIMSYLKDAEAVSFTTDMWTSCQTYSYMTVTAHYLDSSWKLVSCILATRKVADRHTGENLANHLTAIQEEFGISEIGAMTTDNASNNAVAARATGYDHVRCFAHTLQLAVNDGLGISSIARVIVRSRKLVAHFNKSTAATMALEEHQRKINPDQKPLHFISDVETRWNSTFFMFERLIQLRAAVYAVIHTNPPVTRNIGSLELKDTDWTIMEKLTPVLKPLVSATEVLCTDEFTTCCTIIPLTLGLISNHLASSELDSGIVKDFKEKVTGGLRSRVLEGEYWLSIPMIATALAPRYKNLKFLSGEQREQLKSKIISLMEVDNEASGGNDGSEKAKAKNKAPDHESTLDFLIGDIANDDDEDAEVSEGPSAQELEKFLAEKSKANNALFWWSENEKRFPCLSRLAKKYLAIPATSVPSERAFSTAGLTITKQRAALESATADAIIFLNKNLKTFPQGLATQMPHLSDLTPSAAMGSAADTVHDADPAQGQETEQQTQMDTQ